MSVIKLDFGEEMIIWIDGVLGVGKTSAAEALLEKLPLQDTIHLDSDRSYQNGGWKYSGGGSFPQNNESFLSDFKFQIEECAKENEIVIVTMAITMDECRDYLFRQLQSTTSKLIHIILFASKQTVLFRIENDVPTRDKDYAKRNMKKNAEYLGKNFSEAIRLNTDGKSIDEVADAILKIIKAHQNQITR